MKSLGLVFIHVPQTGGNAVRSYLREHLNGETAGPFHGHQRRHLLPRWRSTSWRTVLAVRHPMDATVSSYFKLRTDHHDTIRAGTETVRRRRQARTAMQEDSFDRWFLTSRRFVFAPSWLGAARQADFVLRFEDLASDLHAMLALLGCRDLPPLPERNVTNRPDGFATYYRSRAVRRRAQRIFAPFMDEFGYDFPAGWAQRTTLRSRLEYEVGSRARGVMLQPGD